MMSSQCKITQFFPKTSYKKGPCDDVFDNGIKKILNEVIEMTISNAFTNECIVIQKYVRGYLCRMKMNTIQDGMTWEILEECIDYYNQGLSFYEYINTKTPKNNKRSWIITYIDGKQSPGLI